MRVLRLNIGAHRSENLIPVTLDNHEIVDETGKRKPGIDRVGNWRVATFGVPACQPFRRQAYGTQMFSALFDSDL